MKIVFLLREDKSGTPINSHSGFVLTSIKYELEISDNLLKHSTEVMFFTFESFLFVEFFYFIYLNKINFFFIFFF